MASFYDRIKIACGTFTGFVFLALSIFLFVILLGSQSAKPHTPCAGLWGPVTYLHRGNLNYAQENTFDAIVGGAASNGANPEIDVSALKDGGVVLFHDTSMKRMTGVNNKDLKDLNTADALDTPILAEIDGYNYGSNNSIPEMLPVVEAICNVDENIGINFDTKDVGAVKAGVLALKSSNCIDTDDNTIWSTPYPGVVKEARKELDAAGLTNRIGIYMPSGEYSFLGLKFFLKTRLLQSLLASGSSILVLHKTVFDEEEELIQSWVDDGWCTGIYGIRPEEVSSYTADYYVVDEGPVFPNLLSSDYGGDGEPKVTVYDDNSLASYRGLIAAASLCLVASSIMLFYSAVKCKRATRNTENESEQDDMKIQDDLQFRAVEAQP
mmetsp:Transcript_26556/g.43565  ORF Transcript_26556/g.43565 Transcript_26556/m.43565 type:complete len:381 (+) Transcript_26556:88-1230(+)